MTLRSFWTVKTSASCVFPSWKKKLLKYRWKVWEVPYARLGRDQGLYMRADKDKTYLMCS